MTAESTPPAFLLALDAIRERRLRSEVHLAETPAPARIAPFAVALSADVVDGVDTDLGNGRFVLLFDPDGQEAWDGTFRVVTLVRAELEAELDVDPLLCEAAWSWVTEALAHHPHHSLGGTVTRAVSQPFGALAERATRVEVEIRASWTPDGDMGDHLEAWAAVLCTAAGLPPMPDGVTALGRRR
jgi:hypothetical protein